MTRAPLPSLCQWGIQGQSHLPVNFGLTIQGASSLAPWAAPAVPGLGRCMGASSASRNQSEKPSPIDLVGAMRERLNCRDRRVRGPGVLRGASPGLFALCLRMWAVVTPVFDLYVFSRLYVYISMYRFRRSVLFHTHTQNLKMNTRFGPGQEMQGTEEDCVGPCPSQDTHTAWRLLGPEAAGLGAACGRPQPSGQGGGCTGKVLPSPGPGGNGSQSRRELLSAPKALRALLLEGPAVGGAEHAFGCKNTGL